MGRRHLPSGTISIKRLLIAALPLSVATGIAAPLAAADSGGDLRAGRNLAKTCRQCHAFKPDEPDKFGPNLNGIFGRAAGSVAGYPYSSAMKAAGWVWNAETLDAFMANPAARLPGTQMPFPGLPDAGDRADLIAYLKRATRE